MKIQLVRLLLVGVFVVAFQSDVDAEVPERMRFHGTIQSLGGSPPVDGTYVFLVDVFDQAAGGQLKLRKQVSASVVNGAYGLVLSPSTPGELRSAFEGFPRFLQITVLSGPGGSINEPLLPRQEVVSVPYALSGSDPEPPPPPPLVPRSYWADSDGWVASSSEWETIPGLELTFDLPQGAKVSLDSSGSQYAAAGSPWCQQNYRFSVDDEPMSAEGQSITVNSAADSWVVPWSVRARVQLVAGPHTIRVQTRGTDGHNCGVCGDAGLSQATDYTSCVFEAVAYFE